MSRQGRGLSLTKVGFSCITFGEPIFSVLERKSVSTEFYTDSRCGSPYEAIRYPLANRNRLCSNRGNRSRTSLAFGSKPDESIDALLQFIHGAGTAALGWCLPAAQFLDNDLAWCPWCPLTSEFGSTGLNGATQANRLNVKKASKYAGFQ